MYRFSSNASEEEYNNFVKDYSMASFMQDYAWANVKDNWQNFRCVVYDENKVVAACLVLYKDIFKEHNVFYIPRGYLIDFKNLELLKFMTDSIKALAKENNAFVVKIDPNYAIEEELIGGRYNFFPNFSIDHEIKHDNMLKSGYKYRGVKLKIHENFQPQCNMIVPLCDQNNKVISKDELLSRYKSKFKYYLEPYLSLRGVSFEVTDDESYLEDFVSLLNETEARNNIKLRDINYFKKIFKAFKKRMFLIFASVDLNKYLEFLISNNTDNKDDDEIKTVKKLLEKQTSIKVSTGLVILPINEKGIRVSEYLYAGNNIVLKKLSVSQGLVYEILKISIDKNIHYCNLGGVDGDLQDSLAIFKSKFLPLKVTFVGEYDLVIEENIYNEYIKEA